MILILVIEFFILHHFEINTIASFHSRPIKAINDFDAEKVRKQAREYKCSLAM